MGIAGVGALGVSPLHAHLVTRVRGGRPRVGDTQRRQRGARVKVISQHEVRASGNAVVIDDAGLDCPLQRQRRDIPEFVGGVDAAGEQHIHLDEVGLGVRRRGCEWSNPVVSHLVRGPHLLARDFRRRVAIWVEERHGLARLDDLIVHLRKRGDRARADVDLLDIVVALADDER